MADETETETLWVAQIVDDATGEAVRTSEPTYRRMADRIADGMGRNLNWDKYHTRVVEAPKVEDKP